MTDFTFTDRNNKVGITSSPPPPYTRHKSIDDEFPSFDTSPSAPPMFSPAGAAGNNVVEPVLKPLPNPLTLSSPRVNTITGSIFTPPPTPQSGDFSGNISNKKLEDFQNDIFKRPPKFLLYPTFDEDAAVDQFQGTSPQNPHPQTLAVGGGGVRQGQDSSQAGVIGVVPNISSVTDSNSDQCYSTPQPSVPPFPPEGRWARYSQKVECPHCNILVQTEVEYVNGTVTHLTALGVCWVTCICCFIPYFLNELKDVEHYCPHCDNILGYNQKKVC